MCGIAGIVRQPGEAVSIETLEAMGQAMRHRGPDDGTTKVYSRAGFSFRRLSIIDVAGGAQPLDNEDGSCHVILNGEIYNYAELRADLERRGHRFRTRSDVETVVHGYEEFGDEILRQLRGMFALALWDEPRQRLLLARDRLGKKPLVYHESQGRLTFSSELQGLLMDSTVPRAPDLVAIHHYLSYQYVPSPLTAFEGVRKLPPGHKLVFEKGVCRVEKYWSLSFEPQLKLEASEAAAELRRLLRDAVKVRLMSEVPLGAFLSGGIDSSAVVALMAEFGPVNTFSIGFEDERFNELPFARIVAQRFGTRHSEFIVRPKAAEILPQLVSHYGEPFADSSALPTYYLAKLTREHVTVALNGDGGDELFAGYDRYKLLPFFSCVGRIPGARSFSAALARLDGRVLPPRLRRLLQVVSKTAEESYARTMSYFSPEEKKDLYSDDMRLRLGSVDSFGLIFERFLESDAADLLGRTLYTDMVTYLPGDLLVKVDIATMARSLEGRSPFLDHLLVEFAARLPSNLKLGRRGGKTVLKDAVSELLPPEILNRRKRGFGVPISRWFRQELKELASDTLLSPRAGARPFFKPGVVRRLLKEHVDGRFDHGPRLWSLLMLELWCRRFLDPAG